MTEQLVQIRLGYAADCGDLRLSVESGASGWSAEVRRKDGAPLYSASRYSLSAAKVAAAEFAVFRPEVAAGRATPEAMAQHLSWKGYW